MSAFLNVLRCDLKFELKHFLDILKFCCTHTCGKHFIHSTRSFLLLYLLHKTLFLHLCECFIHVSVLIPVFISISVDQESPHLSAQSIYASLCSTSLHLSLCLRSLYLSLPNISLPLTAQYLFTAHCTRSLCMSLPLQLNSLLLLTVLDQTVCPGKMSFTLSTFYL